MNISPAAPRSIWQLGWSRWLQNLSGSRASGPVPGPADRQPQKKAGRPGPRRGLKLQRYWPALLGIVVLLWLAFTSFYTVKEYEQAVLMTFGKYTRTVSAGLHWKLPWPLQEASILPVNRTQKIELGYVSTGDQSYESLPDDSLMITGDMNVVSIDFFVEWKISDPYKYLFQSAEPDQILRSMLQSSVRSVVGTRSIDDVLTTGKIQIQSDVLSLLMDKVEKGDLGIQVLDVKVNDSEPPTDDIARAFREVENAKQQKDTLINEAQAYRNSKLPEARSEADRILRQAEAEKISRINEAEGEREQFLAVYEQYQTASDLTRRRLYLDTLQQLLPGVTVYLDDGSSVQTLLPLTPWDSDNQAGSAATLPSPSPAPSQSPELSQEASGQTLD
ncbi:FtsH protease activity modulator HflK [Oscillospiraceae bacterium HV4-5-C5C]|nr:FtsH protease activity modulator HflK [Oscillospiraceae bacterium HV4-5-C5C]